MARNGQEQGNVKWFDEKKGYGFISQANGGPDVFVHHSDIQQPYGRKTLRERQEVWFDVVQGPKGLRAVNVSVSPREFGEGVAGYRRGIPGSAF